MSAQTTTTVIEANDGYESYYAEKLWHWIPEIYRTLDADSTSPGALRALIEIVAAEAATLRRDTDRVWDDQSIELCDEWAISYLGTLIGAIPVSAFNIRGNRLAAARAVYYQRRNGTPQVAQELIRDIAGVEGVVVEAFRRLVRFPHRLDFDSLATGPVTGTPAGGLVNLRNPRVEGLHDSAFDESAHFADVRRLRGTLGRYGLSKVNFHLFVLKSHPLTTTTPMPIGDGRFTLDPSGRDVPLFQRGQTSGRAPDEIRETDLPDEILCRRFNASRHELTPEALAVINDPALDTALAPLLGVQFTSGASFQDLVATRLSAAQETTFMAALLDATMVAGSPKQVLWGDSLSFVLGARQLDPSEVVAGDLSNWAATTVFAPFVAIAFDPATGRFIDGPDRGAEDFVAETSHYGQFDDVGAGTYDRTTVAREPTDIDIPSTAPGLGPVTGFSLPAPLVGTHWFTTSQTYEPDLPVGRVFDGITDARLNANLGERPYVRFRPDSATLDITFRAAPQVAGETRTLTIDGLWLGLLAENFASVPVANPDVAATPIRARIILDGAFDRVSLAHMTIDPGGEMARPEPLASIAIPTCTLEIHDQVDLLEIDQCITGPIQEALVDPGECNAGAIRICDSVVVSIDDAEPAIRTHLGHVHLDNTTVIGRVEVARLYASNSIIDGRVRVTDNQNGCFRYSATANFDGEPGGAASLPKQFESIVVDGRFPVQWIESRRFGDPWFAALSRLVPDDIRTGAENGSEMGAFNSRGLAILLNDLASQVRRYLPVGMTPQYLVEHDEETER